MNVFLSLKWCIDSLKRSFESHPPSYNQLIIVDEGHTDLIQPRLPSECLEEIFKYLHDDLVSLHSCALVNRSWCRIAIPLLWSCNTFGL
ncbi:13038_t:CDS:1, partial [Acaulospora morrowiae]